MAMALARIFLMVGGRAPRAGARAGLLWGPEWGRAQPQLFVFARAWLLSPAEQKRERWGVGGDRERPERGAILTVLMPFSPERARPPGAHSSARRARPALQPPPGRGERSTAGAQRRGSRAPRAARPRWNGDGPEPASAPTAPRPSARRLPPRGPGRSRLPPPPRPGPSRPESPAETRDPGPRREAAAPGCARNCALARGSRNGTVES
ncbi:uncharacterized protein [Canis lupus baileyi]|uniref:translation initiation factor IF-2-like n=1 Tax=Canis lupus dingo TaxID=286419 RepID=UPI0020C3567C|nr:translation initiation factor IF-2-like [Canis lupus dingo]